jgi:hypothetical protein
MANTDVSAELAELRARVDVLESRDEIQQLRNRFHDYVNTNRWAEIGALFAEDAELNYSYLGNAFGGTAIGEFFASIPRKLPTDAGDPFIRQFIHGHSVDVDGDTAQGTSYLFATPIYQGRSFLAAGRFEDSYVRREGRWLFKSITFDVYYTVPLAEGWAGSNRHQMDLNSTR